MRELSLHILDIIQNSLAAGATRVELAVGEDTINDILEIGVKDNGKGMTPEELNKVTDPFFTSRTTRKVGLGIPLFKANAEGCNGRFKIVSNVGTGTEVYAAFQHSHIDRVPLGNLVGTVISVLAVNPELHFLVNYNYNGHNFSFDSADVKETLEDVPINNPLILDWLNLYLTENIQGLKMRE
ncbi:MAG: ATP-binding protein [Peptococcaceae bacterium]